MLTANMRALYRRLLVLGFLCASLIFFLSSPNIEKVFALGCLEDCELYELQCIDACPDDCMTDDATCSNCLIQCSADRNWCNSTSTWCGIATFSYESQCSVGFADHCPWDSSIGDFNCNAPSAHSGYYQICTTIGNQQCVACPDGRCVGSNGLPSC
jgi:hypothetical protein